MAKLYINKSIIIKAPIEKVYHTVNNFNHWVAWSPWLIQEPEAQVKVTENRKFYKWQGNRIGLGTMKIVQEDTKQSIYMDLFFLKPWKSKAKVAFEFSSQGETTKVNWLMNSSLPFFLFFLKKMMTALVGMDYQRGLLMLKEYVETGEVNSQLGFKGVSDYEGCMYVGIQNTCRMPEIAQKMAEDFKTIENFVDKDNRASSPFTIYHQWKFVKQTITYTVGIPVKNAPQKLPSYLRLGYMPPMQTYKLLHRGAYKHLGNAWTTMHVMKRAKIFKMNKQIKPFEIYLNDPTQVSEKDILTEINFAVR